jgi:hypothetical protein
MKDNQHEQLFTELTAESEALAFRNLTMRLLLLLVGVRATLEAVTRM